MKCRAENKRSRFLKNLSLIGALFVPLVSLQNCAPEAPSDPVSNGNVSSEEGAGSSRVLAGSFSISSAPAVSSSTRDPLKWPFAASSFWNMPIGTGAIFKSANIPPNQDGGNIWATWPGVDEEILFLNPSAPPMPIYYNANSWNGGNRCGMSSSPAKFTVPMPSNYYIENGNGNYGAAFLLSDQRTLVQLQPLTHCSGYSYATASSFVSPNVDLYGDGRAGAHGGSGLSTLGGTIRLGELRPGQQGPRHALKLDVYAYEVLHTCSGTDCYRWPAFRADNYATASNGYGRSPRAVNNSNPDMKMGALLAIPSSLNINNLTLQTEAAKQLAWTLQNYGAYIVDDGSAAGIFISTEKGPAGNKVDEFQKDYGFPFAQRLNNNSAWVHDMQTLITHLSVVTNNGPNSIGGGGTPLQPLAPAFGSGGGESTGPTPPVFATTYSHLKTYVSGCDGTAALSTTCNTAIDDFCRVEKGYASGGFGPVEHVGDIAYVACVQSGTTSTRLSTTFTALKSNNTSGNPLCSSTLPLSTECASAIGRYCSSKGYDAGGYGPLQFSGDTIVVGCVKAPQAVFRSDSWTTLATYGLHCDGQAAAPKDVCKATINRRCQALGYSSGLGVLEMDNTTAYYSCLK